MVQILLDVAGEKKTVLRSDSCLLLHELLSDVPLSVRCLVNNALPSYKHQLKNWDTVSILPKVHGGKGGFGSMLRAIGAQIEATTNNDACRDLSGKRLRDVKCEKMLKEWAEKKSTEKEDKRERKKIRLQKILDGPSRLKAEDNTYISEMRSMTEGVEAAIDHAISEDHLMEGITLPPSSIKSKKWFDKDLDSSSEDEGSCASGVDEQKEELHQETEKPGTTEKSEIKVTFIDNMDSEDSNEGEMSDDLLGRSPDFKGEVANSTGLDDTSKYETDKGLGLVEDSASTNQTTPYPETADNTAVTENQADTNLPKIRKQADEGQASTERETPSVDWASYSCPEELLSATGADQLKSILTELGLKCGGTPLARSERLISVRGLNKEEYPASVVAGAGKGRKRKIKETVVDR